MFKENIFFNINWQIINGINYVFICRIKSKPEQIKKFWTESDFGYIKLHKESLKAYCKPQSKVFYCLDGVGVGIG